MPLAQGQPKQLFFSGELIHLLCVYLRGLRSHMHVFTAGFVMIHWGTEKTSAVFVHFSKIKKNYG